MYIHILHPGKDRAMSRPKPVDVRLCGGENDGPVDCRHAH